MQNIAVSHKEKENLDIILVCDGAALVGQVGYKVAVKLTKQVKKERMCCLSAVTARSKQQVNIAERAKKRIINGYQNESASKILEQFNKKFTYEITIAKEDLKKIPTIDFYDANVERIERKIVSNVSKPSDRNE